MIGITDAPYDGPLPDEPAVDADEESFLLTSIGRVLERTPTPADVAGRFAGLRPLLAGADAGANPGDATATSDLSRRHAVVPHDGIVTVVGGKLTTARRMAQDALDAIAANGAGPCVTHRIRLAGADRPALADGGADAIAPGIPASHAQAALRHDARAGAHARGPARPPHAPRTRPAVARGRARRGPRGARRRRASLTYAPGSGAGSTSLSGFMTPVGSSVAFAARSSWTPSSPTSPGSHGA